MLALSAMPLLSLAASLCVVLIAVVPLSVLALDNGLASKPPMVSAARTNGSLQHSHLKQQYASRAFCLLCRAVL